jgi:hypothetical protein
MKMHFKRAYRSLQPVSEIKMSPMTTGKTRHYVR